MKRSGKIRHPNLGAGAAGAQKDNIEFHILDNVKRIFTSSFRQFESG